MLYKYGDKSLHNVILEWKAKNITFGSDTFVLIDGGFLFTVFHLSVY